MCGISFVSLTKTSTIDPVAFAANMLTVLEARGTDASGYGWLDPTGKARYVKSANRGRTQAARLRKAEHLAGSRALIMHTRFATLGDPARNENNHPLVRPGTLLCHNGHIANHAEATARYKINRTAEVDSEVLPALIELTPLLVDALDRIAGLRGTAAITWLHGGESAGTVHVARIAGSPVVIGQTVEGDTIGASTEALLRRGCEMTGIELDWVCHLQPGTYLKLVDGIITDWYRFDVARMPTTMPNYHRGSAYARR